MAISIISVISVLFVAGEVLHRAAHFFEMRMRPAAFDDEERYGE